MPNDDLGKLEEIDREIRAGLEDLEYQFKVTEDREARLPGAKAYDALATRLLLWQEKLREIAREVRNAEKTLATEEEGLRSLLQECAGLRGRAEETHAFDPVSYINDRYLRAA